MKTYTILFLSIALFSCSVQSANKPKNQKVVKEVKETTTHLIPEVPAYVIFCGDTIDFTDFDRKERLDQELIVNTYFHSSTILAMKRTGRYFPIFEKILAEEGLPQDLKYLSLIESNLIPTITSPTGARGLWQFMPHTASEYGLRVDKFVDERLDIEKSTRAACLYLKKAYAEFKDWSLACASYNRGVGGMRSDVSYQYGDNYYDLHLNNETGRYLFRLLAMKTIIENPEKYGFNLDEKDKYQTIETNLIQVTSSINDLADWAKKNGSNYRKVRVLNPWILGNTLKLKGDTLNIALPVN